MAGYSRQSVADIIANAVIKAAPVNAEFNAIRDAFAFSGGHKHDGSSTEGAYIPLIADVDANNKVVVDTSNNRISFYVEVGGTAVEQLRIQDGAVVPVTDDDVDLGAVGAEFKDLYVDGIGYIDTIQIHENATITGNLTVNGNTTIGNSATDTVTFNADVASNLIPDADSTRTLGDSSNYWSHGYIDAVTTTGNATVGGNLSVTGTTALTGTATITSADINSGAMDNTTIGASTAAAGTFTNLTSTGTSTHATVDINGGAIDGTTIGSSSPAAITGTTITSTGLGTFPSVNIDGGAIDGTTIGATSAAAGSFTTVTTSGQATLASADINGGTIDGAVIGGSSAAAITGTTITGTSLVGPLTGAVTGNVTGNLTGNVTGNVTGDLTGNVTAASGSSTFNNVTINGGLDMNAGTTATITNLTDPTNAQDAATKNYVDTSIANVIDSAPAALDTLNELAAALGDDANFSTTVTNSIATKLPLAGGTMTGAIAMSTNKITGLGDPTANQDAATKVYVDTQRDTRLALSGGTMTGAIDMGANKITTTYTPTDAADLTTKTYVDAILGSATSAAASAAAAATSESNAATSETNAANSASAAATSESNAAASYDSFDDRYLGAKSSAPTLDNDGDALLIGALYFNTTVNLMYVYSSAGWVPAGSSVNGTSDRVTYTATSGQTVFAATYDTGYVDVYLNGVKLVAGTDFTATNGTSITLATGATTGDIVDIVAYGTFVLADHYTEAQSDARFVNVTGDTMTGNLSFGDNDKAIFGAGSDLQIYHDGTDSFIGEYGVGSLAIRATDLYLQDASGFTYIHGDNTGGNGGTVKIFHDNALKLATTATGIDVTGTVTADGLTVDGNTDLGSTTRGVEFRNYGSGSYRMSGGNSGDPTSQFAINSRASSGSLNFQTNSTNRMYINGGTGDIYFYEDTGTTPKFYWDASAEVLGIGTTQPFTGRSNTMTISSTAPTLYLEDTDSGSYTNCQLAFLGGDFTISTGIRSGTSTSGSVERLRIDSSGNVGIGTSSPDVLLELAKGSGEASLKFTRTNTASTGNDFGRLLFENSAGTVMASIRAYSGSGNTEAGFTFGAGLNDNECARIDNNGNVYVATTNGNPTGNHEPGTLISALGQVNVHRDGGNPLRVGNSIDGNLTEYYRQGALVMAAGVTNTDEPFISRQTATISGIKFRNGAVVPCGTTGADVDNVQDIGFSNARWDDIYATNGTIQTSDRNEKQDIEALSDAEQRVAVAAKGLLRKYRWKDAVAEKGDAARIHFGIIAQDLQEAFEAEGLDAGRYGMFISSTWWEAERVIPAVAEELDEEGNVITEAQEERTVTDTYQTQEEAPEGATEKTRMGIRYPELLAFIIAAL